MAAARTPGRTAHKNLDGSCSTQPAGIANSPRQNERAEMGFADLSNDTVRSGTPRARWVRPAHMSKPTILKQPLE